MDEEQLTPKGMAPNINISSGGSNNNNLIYQIGLAIAVVGLIYMFITNNKLSKDISAKDALLEQQIHLKDTIATLKAQIRDVKPALDSISYYVGEIKSLRAKHIADSIYIAKKHGKTYTNISSLNDSDTVKLLSRNLNGYGKVPR